jgi:hypothetical protein
VVPRTGLSVGPNPWSAEKSGGIRFFGAPEGARVDIFSSSGAFVRSLTLSSSASEWDLLDQNGSPVASGIYLYRIAGSDAQKSRGVLTVVR